MSFIAYQIKVSGAKDHGKNYIEVRPPLVRHLLSIGIPKKANAFVIQQSRTLSIRRKTSSELLINARWDVNNRLITDRKTVTVSQAMQLR